MKVADILKELFAAEGITDRDSLDSWTRLTGMVRVYDYVRAKNPEWWASVPTPANTVRRNYQELLPGYKVYKG
jgi:hypothetical protein